MGGCDTRRINASVKGQNCGSTPPPHPSASHSFSIPLPRLHGVSRVHAILHSFAYPLKPLTQAPMSIQFIPILHATHNHVHSIRTHRIRDSSHRHSTQTPIASGISPPPILHLDAYRIRNSPAAIPSGHIAPGMPPAIPSGRPTVDPQFCPFNTCL